jgi:hypothetical protein
MAMAIAITMAMAITMAIPISISKFNSNLSRSFGTNI